MRKTKESVSKERLLRINCCTIKTMKYILAIILFSLSFSAYAEETLCPINNDIPNDMRIKESDLTKESAENALKVLNAIISGENKSYIWITVPNAMKTIEGYILKRDALANRSGIPEYDTSSFCGFMKKGYWYD